MAITGVDPSLYVFVSPMDNAKLMSGEREGMNECKEG